MSDFSFSGALSSAWKAARSFKGSLSRAFDRFIYDQPAITRNGMHYMLVDENTIRAYTASYRRYAGVMSHGFDYNLDANTVRSSSLSSVNGADNFSVEPSGFVTEHWHVRDDERGIDANSVDVAELKEIGTAIARDIVKQADEDGRGVPKKILSAARCFIERFEVQSSNAVALKNKPN